ncbi:serine/threonine-protein kinase pim-3-like [Triplophysa rosa]|uniref:serine/threonine-protein kinase pim-3-like n=1 Tax=Triplophysa rosa TaxID=992332 RepID=UPI002545DD08|nr:serine/threonine-protein kinase pim-3-like [Triplophysa rosa]
MNRSLPEEQPTRRGICAFFRRKLQAFRGPASNGGQRRLDDPLPGEPVVAEPQPEVDLTGPTKVPLESMYDLHGKKLQDGFLVATRRSDGQEVLLNVFPRKPKHKIFCPGFWSGVDKRVAWNVLLSRRERSQHVQQLHRWFEGPKKMVLVYENLSTTLEKYVKKSGGKLCEAEARGLVKQAAEGVKHSLDHGVFHETVFDTNFFIEEKTKMLKLSLSGEVKRIPSVHEISQFKGRATVLENMETDRCYAEFTAVWHLGELAYEMIHGHETKIGKAPKLDSSLSRECRDFIRKCLKNDKLDRISLEELMAHEWINGVEEGPSDPDVSEPVPGPFHVGHTAEVELPGPTTAPLDSMNQGNEKQLFEGAFMMTQKSAGRKVIMKVLTQDAEGATHSLSWVQEDC